MKKALGALLLLLGLVCLALAGFGVASSWREQGAAMPETSRLVATPTGRVAVALSGPAEGPPILLVHGTAAWSGFWKDVAAHLADRGWRVIAVDLPPFGWSDHDPQARYDRTTQAARLAAVIGAVGGGKAVVVGHSFGAGAATELALRHPERVRTLVLVDAALGVLDPPPGEAGAVAGLLGHGWIARPLVAVSVTNPSAMGPLVRSMIAKKEQAAPWLDTLRRPMLRQGTTEAYAAWLPALFTADDGGLSRKSAELSHIAVPVALIWGDADTVTPMAQGETIAKLTHARSFTRLAGVGHIPHIEDPKAFLAALDAATEPDRGDKGWHGGS